MNRPTLKKIDLINARYTLYVYLAFIMSDNNHIISIQYLEQDCNIVQNIELNNIPDLTSNNPMNTTQDLEQGHTIIQNLPESATHVQDRIRNIWFTVICVCILLVPNVLAFVGYDCNLKNDSVMVYSRGNAILVHDWIYLGTLSQIIPTMYLSIMCSYIGFGYILFRNPVVLLFSTAIMQLIMHCVGSVWMHIKVYAMNNATKETIMFVNGISNIDGFYVPLISWKTLPLGSIFVSPMCLICYYLWRFYIDLAKPFYRKYIKLGETINFMMVGKTVLGVVLAILGIIPAHFRYDFYIYDDFWMDNNILTIVNVVLALLGFYVFFNIYKECIKILHRKLHNDTDDNLVDLLKNIIVIQLVSHMIGIFVLFAERYSHDHFLTWYTMPMGGGCLMILIWCWQLIGQNLNIEY